MVVRCLSVLMFRSGGLSPILSVRILCLLHRISGSNHLLSTLGTGDDPAVLSALYIENLIETLLWDYRGHYFRCFIVCRINTFSMMQFVYSKKDFSSVTKILSNVHTTFSMVNMKYFIFYSKLKKQSKIKEFLRNFKSIVKVEKTLK